MKLVPYYIVMLSLILLLGQAALAQGPAPSQPAGPAASSASDNTKASAADKDSAKPVNAAKTDSTAKEDAPGSADKNARPLDSTSAAPAVESGTAPRDFSTSIDGNSPAELKPAQAQAAASGSQQSDANGTVPGLYSIHSNAEVGWRFLGNSGSFDQYRSDLNYDRGIRLMSGDFVAKAENGSGALFDNILFNAFGWGGDPTEYTHLQVEKDNWYRFDASYRRIDYFNNLANFALGQHLADTQFQIGDYDLTLLPQNRRLKIYLGYSEDRDQGISTVTYDYSRNEFPIVAPVRTSSDEYRFGFDAKLWVFDISFMQGFRYYKDDTTYNISSPELGNGAPSATTINSLVRDLPTRGTTPYTRFNIHTQLAKRVDITGQLIYSDSTTNYSFFESVIGTNASHNIVDPDLSTFSGNAKRPDWMGDIGLTVFATDRLTISDTLRYNDFRINGGDNFLEALSQITSAGVPLPVAITEQTSLTLVSYRELRNTIEADYRFTKWLEAHGGYRHTNRTDGLANITTPPPTPFTIEGSSNNTNSGFGGFRLRPVTPWTLYFDFERGQADNVFVRVANYDYTNIRFRNMIRVNDKITINASVVTKDNDNPALVSPINPTPFGVNIISRIYSGSLDWNPTSKFYFSGGYTYDRLDSNAAIILFFSNKETLGSSLYFMRDHYFYVNSRWQPHPRLALYGGVRLNKDLGQGDRTASSPSEILSSYPLRFGTPEARVTFNANRHFDFNAGYQYYSYVEKLVNAQNFAASLGYVSVTLKFNRE